MVNSCITIDIKPHPHPGTAWCMENYWTVPFQTRGGGFNCTLYVMQQFFLILAHFCVLRYLCLNLGLIFSLGILSTNVHRITVVFKRGHRLIIKALPRSIIKVTSLKYYFSITHNTYYLWVDNYSSNLSSFLPLHQTVTSGVCWMCLLLVLAPIQQSRLGNWVGLQ